MSHEQVIESKYFRRHAPHIAEKNEQRKRHRALAEKGIAVTAGIASCILLGYGAIQLASKTSSPAITAKVQKIEKNKPVFNLQLRLRELTLGLADKKIALLTSARNRKFHTQKHEKALELWGDFFMRHGLDFEQRDIAELQQLPPDTIVIAPQFKSLSMKQRKAFKDYQGPLVFTGQTGYLNGLGNVSNNHFLRDLFGVTREKGETSLEVTEAHFNGGVELPRFKFSPLILDQAHYASNGVGKVFSARDNKMWLFFEPQVYSQISANLTPDFLILYLLKTALP